MLFVMVIHFNLYSQAPYMICYFNEDILSSADKGMLLTKHLIQSLTCVAVPCFILISGWFGINFKIRGILKLYLQCLFCEVLAYFTYILLSEQSINSNEIFNLFTFKSSNYWFLKGYLLLYLISPALNKIIDSLKDKWLVIATILLIAPMLYLNYIGKQGGLILFSIIYMIGRCLKKCVERNWILVNGGGKWLAIYLFCSITIFILAIIKLFVVPNFSFFHIYNEFNPLIILSAVSLMMFFLSLDIKRSNVINRMAGSVFAAYIIQENHFLGYMFLYPAVGELLNNCSLIPSMALLFLCALVLMTMCILADIFLKYIYNFILEFYDFIYRRVTVSR